MESLFLTNYSELSFLDKIKQSPEDALVREIQEELDINITVDKFICTTNHDYPSFHLTMHCYLCSIVSGNVELREHKSARWLTVETLTDVEWLPADREVVEKIRIL